MKTASITLVTLLGLGLAMPAVARDHDDHRDDHRRAEHREHERERDHEQWRHEHERERDHERRHDPFARKDPPGWEHGKKKGWGDCDVPPGQAKKQGCYENHEYHHASSPPRVIERPVIVNRPVVVNHPVVSQPLPRPQAPTKKPVFVPHTPEQIRDAQRQQRR